MPWIARRRPSKAGIRHADPHSGDGSLSGSHLASPISMHYLGPPPFRVPPTLREFPAPMQANIREASTGVDEPQASRGKRDGTCGRPN